MIVDEEEIGQRFLVDLLRMQGKGDLEKASAENTAESFDENLAAIMLELEMADEDINEPDCWDFISVHEEAPEPIVAITRRPLSDSRKNWKIGKVIVGARRCFSA
ncbi:MAG: hypothetical protein HY885_14485 [Deltaproteobacteria bacterium]|nr:hypothetical protein [Deltaproteobacteria bacterium]